jgi:hypothetical protein
MSNGGLNADFQQSSPKNGEDLKRRAVLLGSNAPGTQVEVSFRAGGPTSAGGSSI